MSDAIHVRKAITVRRPIGEVYRAWENFTEFPRFMAYLDSVENTGPRISHWRAHEPGGNSLEWDAEVTEHEPNTVIAWRSLEGGDLNHSGKVKFREAPMQQGTEVLVEMYYAPRSGGLAGLIGRLSGNDPTQVVQQDLRRFKQVMELGEVVRSDASIHEKMHAAQPSEEPVAVNQ